MRWQGVNNVSCQVAVGFDVTGIDVSSTLTMVGKVQQRKTGEARGHNGATPDGCASTAEVECCQVYEDIPEQEESAVQTEQKRVVCWHENDHAWFGVLSAEEEEQ